MSVISKESWLRPAIQADLLDGVRAQIRTDGKHEFVFLMNFSSEKQWFVLNEDYIDMLNGVTVSGRIELQLHGVCVLKKEVSFK
ncbi:Beta-galactosidase C-terminal domain [Anaerobacillus alkaliphilus]|uniref:Beta-galactosidase C-terminal domain n=1 Tax=Anaerobacillus alkaliphilus TaxID=1548597 RepID=UPI001F4F6773|nr:Beta-galactosidase C-terminal domain [Anaerobacillus alkaliphilus]